ncbi:MAG: DUF4430 domain-containing protein [Clostridia bacterium]|nr:DUF4430 domain-containing protein [Clostridia bacterium]
MKMAIRITLLLLALVMSVSFVACADIEKTGAWETASYDSDKTFGNGSKTIQVEVKAEEQSLTFTIKTDAETLREAMEEHRLIAGDEGPYGLYVKAVNGVVADFDNGGYWWGLSKNGESLMTGVDGVIIADGEHYEFTRTNTYE